MGFLEDLFNYEDPVARVRRSMNADIASLRAAASESWALKDELNERLDHLELLIAETQRTQAAIVQVLVDQDMASGAKIQALIAKVLEQERVSRTSLENQKVDERPVMTLEEKLDVLKGEDQDMEFDHSRTAYQQMIDDDIDALGHMANAEHSEPKPSPPDSDVADETLPISAPLPPKPSSDPEPQLKAVQEPEPVLQVEPPSESQDVVVKSEDSVESPSPMADPPATFERKYDDKGKYQF